ncbi:Rv3235 family protein [Actinokineospora sp. NBRC 105648]|uniref:Rv3235 family protein n=1 Tax=Actinokineospora sp. NBRC 105648 TaxID=3032206 RepID=UPI0024A3E76A|nr:Rv3235 family protein [Actinokineospora sp. NBRC 105648]GLZ38469.1 hypothetical protein Acsp05_20930 [Actinokineospora sp. NBRC 105648]
MRVTALPPYEPPIAEYLEERWATPPANQWSQGPLRDDRTTRELSWRMLLLLMECLEGKRPLTQLHTILTPPVYEAMLTRTRTPSRLAHRLMSLRTCHVAPGVVEICASVRVSPRTYPDAWRLRAVAGRLAQTNGTWRCTALRLVGS